VTWTIQGDSLTRTETITAQQPVTLSRFFVMFPTTGTRVFTTFDQGRRTDRFESPDGPAEVALISPSVSLISSIVSTGDGPLGKGNRFPIPLILQMEATDVAMGPGKPFTWTIRLRTPARE
jgi:hypothetical protein